MLDFTDIVNQLAQNYDPFPVIEGMKTSQLMQAATTPTGPQFNWMTNELPVPQEPWGTPPYKSTENVNLGDKVLAETQGTRKEAPPTEAAPLTPQQMAMLSGMMPKPVPFHYAPPVAPTRGISNLNLAQFQPGQKFAALPSLAQILGIR